MPTWAAIAIVIAVAVVAAMVVVVVLLMRRLLSLWWLMRDPDAPLRAKLALGGTAAYVVSPIDLLPDPLLVDDIGLLAVMLAWLPGIAAALQTPGPATTTNPNKTARAAKAAGLGLPMPRSGTGAPAAPRIDMAATGWQPLPDHFKDPWGDDPIGARRARYQELVSEAKRLAPAAVKELRRQNPGGLLPVEFHTGRKWRPARGWPIGTGWNTPTRGSTIHEVRGYGDPHAWYVLTDASVRRVKFISGVGPVGDERGRCGDDVIAEEYRREKSRPRGADGRAAAKVTAELNERVIRELETAVSLLRDVVPT